MAEPEGRFEPVAGGNGQETEDLGNALIRFAWGRPAPFRPAFGTGRFERTGTTPGPADRAFDRPMGPVRDSSERTATTLRSSEKPARAGIWSKEPPGGPSTASAPRSRRR